MPGNPFKKAAPRPNIRASVRAPAKMKGASTAPVPKQPMAPPKSAPAAKLGKIRVTTKARKSLSPPHVRQGVVPGSTPGKPGSSPNAKPW